MSSLVAQIVKASAYSVGDLGSIPESERSPGEGNGNPLQYSCLGNPMDGGTWWATVHGVTKSLTWLSGLHFLQPMSGDWCRESRWEDTGKAEDEKKKAPERAPTLNFSGLSPPAHHSPSSASSALLICNSPHQPYSHRPSSRPHTFHKEITRCLQRKAGKRKTATLKTIAQSQITWMCWWLLYW